MSKLTDKFKDVEAVKQAFATSFTNKEALQRLGFDYMNGSTTRVIKRFKDEHGLDTSHFDPKKVQRKYPIVEKECPVCSKPFEAALGSPREKQTCSYSCSNTYFRSGEDNPNYKDGSNEHGSYYRTVCFQAHGKKCIICGEEKIVAAHHINEEHTDNRPENLVPLCPTHHVYAHTNDLKEDIQLLIDEFIAQYTTI